MDQLRGKAAGNLEPDSARRVRDVLSDAYSFIRSAETNKAFSTVSIELLMDEQIQRNGESGESGASQYNPYSYNPDKVTPAGNTPVKLVNPLSGTLSTVPTKLDRITAIANEMQATIKEIKAVDPIDVVEQDAYDDALEGSVDGDEDATA